MTNVQAEKEFDRLCYFMSVYFPIPFFMAIDLDRSNDLIAFSVN